jgi:hypothetical protein
MRKGLIRSARGEVVDFDDLVAKASQKPVNKKTSEVVKKIKEAAKPKAKLSGHIPKPSTDEKSPAEETMIVLPMQSSKKKKEVSTDQGV